MKSSSLNYPERYRATPRPIVIDSLGRRFGPGEVRTEVILGFHLIVMVVLSFLIVSYQSSAGTRLTGVLLSFTKGSLFYAVLPVPMPFTEYSCRCRRDPLNEASEESFKDNSIYTQFV